MKTKQEIKEIMLKALKEHYKEFLEDRALFRKNSESRDIESAQYWEASATKQRAIWSEIWDLLEAIGVNEKTIIKANEEARIEHERDL